MTTFWSLWIMVLVTINLGITLFLFLWGQKVRIPTLPDGTTGHVWAHGVLREGLHTLPKWWVFISGSLFIAAFCYLILYPGYGRYKGLLGWSAHGELAQDMVRNHERLESLVARLRQEPVETLAGDQAATAFGHRLFLDNCAACHSTSGKGNQVIGAPNLVDRDWLYGGDPETLLESITNGRQGVMPPHGALLGTAGVQEVAQYVLSLSGHANDPLKAELGKDQFTPCSACHGADGKGNHALGAPDLTDTTWLYGGGQARIEQTIRDGRSGEMPGFRDRLSDSEIKAVAAWVYSQSNPTGGQ